MTFIVKSVHGFTFGRGVFYYSNHGFFWKVNLNTKQVEMSRLPEKSCRVDFVLLVRTDKQESPVYGYPSEIGHAACPEHKTHSALKFQIQDSSVLTMHLARV